MFDAMNVTGPGTGFRLNFSLLTDPPMFNLSEPFNVEDPCSVHIDVEAANITVAGYPFNVIAYALDFKLQVQPQYRPTAEVYWHDACAPCANATLDGRTDSVATDGIAVFTDLAITSAGTFHLNVRFPGSSGFSFGVPDIYTIKFDIVNDVAKSMRIVLQPGAGLHGRALQVPGPHPLILLHCVCKCFKRTRGARAQPHGQLLAQPKQARRVCKALPGLILTPFCTCFF